MRQAGPPRSPGLLPKYLRLERKELLTWPTRSHNCRSSPAYLTGTAGADNHKHASRAAALLLSRSQDLAGATGGRTPPLAGLPD